MRCIKTLRVSVFVVLFLSLLYQATGAQMQSEAAVPFDPAVNLSNTLSDTITSNNSNTPAVASLGDKVYVVWVEESSTGPDPLMTREIRFRSSTDGGVNFGDAPSGKVVAIPDGFVGSLRVAASGNNVYIVFGGPGAPDGASVTFIRSMDGGATFGSPVTIPAGGSSPDMAVDGLGNIHVVSGAVSTGEIFYTRSIDGGSTFSTPQKISTPTADSFFPRIAAAGSQVGVVWHDTIETGDIFNPAQGEIQFVFSDDSGATFSSLVNLSNSTSNSILAAIAIGNSIQVVWSEVGQVAHRSSGDGVNFTPIQFLGPATGGSLPESVFPEVAASGSVVSVAWIEDDALSGLFLGLFFRRSIEGGANFTPAQNLAAGLAGASTEPVALAAGSPVKVAWTHSSSGLPADNEILFRRETPTNHPPVVLADGPYLGVVGFGVKMDASASSDPEGQPLTYKWDFGDGSTLVTTEPIIYHSYASAGMFTVTLVVNDGQLDSAPFTTTATIDSQAAASGGGQSGDVDAFLAYTNPPQRSTDLPAGTASFNVTIIYGPTIVPSTFQAFLNGAPFVDFTPVAGTSETVTIPLALGRNVLLLHVDGLLSTGRTATDRDRLTFIIP